jgi:hypothetical protein
MYIKSNVGGRLLGLVGVWLTFCDTHQFTCSWMETAQLTRPDLFLGIDRGFGMLNLGTEGTKGVEEFTEVLLLSREWLANDGSL